MIEVAVKAAQKAVDALNSGQSLGYALDTLAHLKHHQGDLDAAIKLQTREVKEASEEQLKDYLAELKKEKDGGDDDK